MNVVPERENSAVVATFHNLASAEAFGEYLLRHGVGVKVQDERRWQRYWFLARPSAGVHVQVLKERLPLGELMLEDWEATVTRSRRAVHCPACDSSRVQYPQMTRRFLLPTIVAQVGVWLGVFTPSYYCESCHYTWTKRSSWKRPQKTHRVLHPRWTP